MGTHSRFGGEREASSSEQALNRLRAEFGRGDLARHLALFYQEPTEQLEVAAAFVAHGLQTNNRCLYITDENSLKEVETAFRSIGIDVDERQDAGDLVLREATEVYLQNGFDPDRMIATLESESESSLERGYDGLWIAGENTWCFHTKASFDHILDFEAAFDAECPAYPVTALCQYDVDRFSEESVAKALWTHEQIIFRHTICDNPYYTAPSEYRSTADPTLNAQLMLEQTYDLAHSRRELRRREQRLEVVNRILRHNIRNDLNIVRGSLEQIEGSEEIGDTNRRRLATAKRYVDEVVDLSEKARYLERSLRDSTIESIDLAPCLERSAAQVERSIPGAVIDAAGDYDVTIIAGANLEKALVELFDTALRHQSGDSPRLLVTGSFPSAELVRLEVEAPSALMPASDRQALQRGSETKLEHGSSLGPWLVKWIVEKGYGTLDFPADESKLGIELRRVPE